MPLKITYIKNGGVLLKGEGVVSGSEIIQANESLYSSPEITQKIKYQLCDFTNVSSFLVSNEDILLLANQDETAAQVNPNMFIALVGAQDLIYGLIRMWGKRRGSHLKY